MRLRKFLWYFRYLCWYEPTFVAIRRAIMCDTLYFSQVGRHSPELLISLVLQISLSAHFLHFTYFVKSSRPPALDPLIATFRLR